MLYESQYYGIVDLASPYLMHHGVKGQKWYHRRYQNDDGSLTALGYIHYGIGKGRKEAGAKDLVDAYRTKRKEERAVKKAERAAARAERKEEKAELNKEKLLISGSAKEVLKNADKLTNQELQQAVNRLNMKRQLSQLEPPKESFIKKLNDKINTYGTLANTIVNAKTNIDKLSEAFRDPEEKAAEEATKAREKAYQKAFNESLEAAVKDIFKKTREETEGTSAEKERAAKLAVDKFMKETEDARTGKKKEDYDSFTERLAKQQARAKAKEHNNQVKEEMERAKQLDKSIDKEIDSAKAQSAAWEHETLERLKGSRSNLSEAVKYYEADRVAQKHEQPEARDSQAAWDTFKKIANDVRVDHINREAAPAVKSFMSGIDSYKAPTPQPSLSEARAASDRLSAINSAKRQQAASENFDRTYRNVTSTVSSGKSVVQSIFRAVTSSPKINSVSGSASVSRGRELAQSNDALRERAETFLDDLDK